MGGIPTPLDERKDIMSIQGKDYVTITDHSTGQSMDLPILRGTDGVPVIDINQLRKKMNLYTKVPLE